MKTKTQLYALAVNVWHANDYLNERNCDPMRTEWYLFGKEEDARNYAISDIDHDNEVYNDGTIYSAELNDDEILEASGFDTMDDFNEALATPNSKEPWKIRNFGELEKEDVAKAVADADGWNGIPCECANYDFNKTLDGAIIVTWEWERYIGYARNIIGLRYGNDDDTEASLTKEDRCYRPQCDVVLTKDEVDGCEDLEEALRHELLESRDWKWTKRSFVEELIAMIA